MTQSISNPFEFITDRELFNTQIDKHTPESYEETKRRVLLMCEKYREQWLEEAAVEDTGVKIKRTRKKKEVSDDEPKATTVDQFLSRKLT